MLYGLTPHLGLGFFAELSSFSIRVWQLRQKSEAEAMILTVVQTQVNPMEVVMRSEAELSTPHKFNSILFV